MEQEHAETHAQFKSIREDSQQLWKIKSYVDSARKNSEQAQQRIDVLAEKLSAEKAGPVCPQCGHGCGTEDAFCPACGTRLPRKE